MIVCGYANPGTTSVATPEAQAIYAKYGFIPATADELMPKPISGS